MRIKIILLTLISGVTALVLAQSAPPGSTVPNPGTVPGSPGVTPQHVTTNPTNAMGATETNWNPGSTNGSPATNAWRR